MPAPSVSCLQPAEQQAAGMASAFLPSTVSGLSSLTRRTCLLGSDSPASHPAHVPGHCADAQVSGREEALRGRRSGTSGDTAVLGLAWGRGSSPPPPPAAMGPGGWISPCLAFQQPLQGEGMGGRQGFGESPYHRSTRAAHPTPCRSVAWHSHSTAFSGLLPAPSSCPRVTSPCKETGSFFDQIQFPLNNSMGSHWRGP